MHLMLLLRLELCYGCAISSTRCCCDGWSYLLWLCDQLYSMLLRWQELSVLAVRSDVFDAVAMAGAIGIGCAIIEMAVAIGID